ncbi:MAG TPA: hypothetical protein VGC24_07915 [Burkholderiaceae bacterium]
MFHIQRRCEGLANALARLAQGATSRRQTLKAQTTSLAPAWNMRDRLETQVHQLARDIRTLVQWLRQDILALAGPALATRRELFDFIIAELAVHEPEDPRRIRPVRVALQNQRDTLPTFAGVLNDKLAAIACAPAIPKPLVRDACVLHRFPSTSPAYWQGWNLLHQAKPASSLKNRRKRAG